jgi:hypothetical protein
MLAPDLDNTYEEGMTVEELELEQKILEVGQLIVNLDAGFFLS